MTIKPIPGADQPLTLDAIRERDRWADQVPAEGGITSAQRAMDRRWLLAEVDRLRAIEASFVAVHSHRVGDASPETAAPCGEPDASLEARAEALGKAISEAFGPVVAPPQFWRDTCIALVRAVDASRPTLTEEQARRGWFLAAAWARLAQARAGAMQAFDEDYESTRNARGWLESIGVNVNADPPVVIPENLRASRGETGSAADPRTTLHADDPASLADVVAASAREPHADVVLHALHVSGGAAAVASLDEKHVLVTSRVDGVTRTTVDGEHVPLRRAAGPKCNNCDDTGTCGACNAEPVDPPCVLCSLGDCLCGERRGNREP